MNLILNNRFVAISFIVFIAAVVFIPFLGNCPLFDWDEINFAECAREMVVTGDYSQVQLNYNPFWEKPPFFIWLQALSMNVFGVNEFAARFPNAVCGILSMVVLFFIGKKTNSPAFGLTWVLVYAGTLLPHFYFRSGIIDPWFNLFIFLSFYNILIHLNNPVGRDAVKSALLAGFFLGIAVLTKGPAAVVIIGTCAFVYWALKRFQKVTSWNHLLLFLLSFLVTGCSWFIVELLNGNGAVIKAFFDYQVRLFNTEDSDHGGFLLYHFVVLLAGCFPTSLFFLMSLKRPDSDTPYQRHIRLGMLILFFVVLVIFTLVKTKIVHYSSMCYLPMTYLGTYSVFKITSGEYKLKSWFTAGFVAMGLLLGLAFTLVGCIDLFKPALISSGLIHDDFAIANLKADVKWGGWEWLPGLCFLVISVVSVYFIRKGAKKIVFYLYGFNVVFIMSSILIFAPKIEQYSQHAAIEFYKAVADKDFYVETSGFKSYAYLFYSNKPPEQNQNPEAKLFVKEKLDKMEQEGHSRVTSFSLAFMNWMQFGKIDRPAVFVCKLDGAEILLRDTNIKKMYSKNGFVFCVRMPEK
ncbi:MAG: ArnT family glycosyltransferase [Bacteroidia bacterium]